MRSLPRALTLTAMTLVMACGETVEAGADAEDGADAVVAGTPTMDVPAVGYLAHGLLVEGRWLVVLPFCTGTLIAPDVVLTAAHCVENARAEKYDLHFGTGDTRKPKVLVPVAETVIHPRYRAGTTRLYANDLAYLVLSSPINGVPLATVSEQRHTAGCDYVLTGYGTQKNGHRYDDAILDTDNGYRKALSVCAEAGYVSSPSPVTNGTIRTRGEDGAACVGDSGGPLRLENTREIVGVLSNLGTQGDGARCITGAPAYYAPLANNMAFVEEALAKSTQR